MANYLEEYQQLVSELDLEIKRVASLHGATIHCRPGCSGCCRPFSIFAIEAQCLGQAVEALLRSGQDLQVGGCEVCALLVDGRCAVYEVRPLICRTQGLPIGYIDHERSLVEVSACGLNFPGEPEYSVQQLLMMDEMNDRLQRLNSEFCVLRSLDPWQRVPIRDIVEKWSLPKRD